MNKIKDFFRSVGAKMQGWMSGRYGYDELSRALSVAALILLVLACIPWLRFMYVPALLLWIWSLVRCYSRKVEKRRAERETYLRFAGRIKSWFSVKKKAWKERKTHRYFRCKQCGAVLRVPKGKGRIKINCPKCHGEIIKKT